MLRLTSALLLLIFHVHLSPVQSAEKGPNSADVVIYGGTSGGIAAAIQVSRMGKSVILIEPSSRIGGLTTGGLGQTDIGNKAAIGGISLEFYQNIRRHYNNPENWKWQKPEEYRGGGQSRTAEGEQAMWTFEPSAALKIYNDMLSKEKVILVTDERLNRETGVKKSAGRIVSITMESGTSYAGKVFLDATYEGDLFAAAGVKFIVGREANATYNETLNGVQTQHAVKHQLKKGIDPHIKKGDATSGLLPFIDPNGPGKEGSRDHRVQAYCFRMCLTDHPENRIPFFKPEGYDPLWYELLLRNFEAGERSLPFKNDKMPNRKTDTNNNFGYSTDFIGQNYKYPEASYAEREKIVKRHRLYQQGLMWTLANHPRVPDHVRKEFSRWGTSKDEFAREDGWQEQLYIREARRMVGDYVMTQHNCQGRHLIEDPVGMAAYTMDSHNVQRYVDANGHAQNEGDVQVGGFPPYPISYRSLLPKKEECTNLLVPVSLSATHIAFGSIRMEPVFMVLGQSAATAACQSIDAGVSLHELDYAKLKEKLLTDKQVLAWTGSRYKAAARIPVEKLKGIVVDDADAELKGFGLISHSIGPFVGIGYRHDNNENKGKQSAKFVPKLPESGWYEVRLSNVAHGNRDTKVPVTIHHAEGEVTKSVNQTKAPADSSGLLSLGHHRFEKGTSGWVMISNEGTKNHVIVDAVQFLYLGKEKPKS